MDIQWDLHTFDALSNRDLYGILRLRSEIFVVEQKSIYLDADDLDVRPDVFHFYGKIDQKIIAYSRIFAPGLYGSSTRFGRITVHTSLRGTGVGHMLVNKTMEIMYARWPACNINISAQSYLRKFYEKHGFKVSGEEYLEDGIPHLPMNTLP